MCRQEVESEGLSPSFTIEPVPCKDEEALADVLKCSRAVLTPCEAILPDVQVWVDCSGCICLLRLTTEAVHEASR